MVSVSNWELYLSWNWNGLYFNWCMILFQLFEEIYVMNGENMLNESVWECNSVLWLCLDVWDWFYVWWARLYTSLSLAGLVVVLFLKVYV